MEINSFCLGVITAAPPDRSCPISQFTAWQHEAKQGKKDSPFCPRQEESLPCRCPQEGYFCAQVAAGSRDGAWSRALRTWRHRVIHVFTCPSSSLCSASLSFAPHRLQPEKLFLCLAHGASFHSRRPPSGCVAAHKNPRGAIRITESQRELPGKRSSEEHFPLPSRFPQVRCTLQVLPLVPHSSASGVQPPGEAAPSVGLGWDVRVRGEHHAHAVCWKEP